MGRGIGMVHQRQAWCKKRQKRHWCRRHGMTAKEERNQMKVAARVRGQGKAGQKSLVEVRNMNVQIWQLKNRKESNVRGFHFRDRKMRGTRNLAIGKQESFRREDAKFGHVPYGAIRKNWESYLVGSQSHGMAPNTYWVDHRGKTQKDLGKKAEREKKEWQR